MKSLKDVCDTIKHIYMGIMCAPEGEEREKHRKNI